MSVTIIDLLRHGECEGGSIYRGSTDVALTEMGWQQMQKSVEALKEAQILSGVETPWDQIITSPLQRCRVFSETLSAQYSLPVRVESDFREMDFGRWEGRGLDEVWTAEPEAVKRFYSDPEQHSPPGGEPVLQVRERLAKAWQLMLDENKGKHLLLVQHGGTIRVLLTWLLQMPLSGIIQFNIPYAGACRIKVVEDKKGQAFPSLVFFNGAGSE